MPATMRFAPDALIEFCRDVLCAVGVPDEDSRLLADSLVRAELWGHPSHGVLRLPWYVARIRRGSMMPVTRHEIVVDKGAVAVLDGHEGIGQVVTAAAGDECLRRARQHGVGVVGVRNSNHFGMGAYFTLKLAEQGCVAMLTSNSSPAMAPWGGRSKAVGSNPWSIAAPAGRHGTCFLDIANTAVARGKIYAAIQRAEKIPPDWAIASDGSPTTDPDVALAGLALPMGAHKGFAIALMMDVLSGVLTGSAFATDVSGPYQAERLSGCGHLCWALDIATVMDPAEFDGRMEQLIQVIRGVPLAPGHDRIYFPGEKERNEQARNSHAGVALPARTIDELRRLAHQTGIADDALAGRELYECR